MVVTIFRNRLRKDAVERYGPVSQRMDELARSMPGFVSAKTFTADDGERLTLVEFEDAEAQLAWKQHAEHRVAQGQGRSDFYDEYKIYVCEKPRVVHFVRPDDANATNDADAPSSI